MESPFALYANMNYIDSVSNDNVPKEIYLEKQRQKKYVHGCLATISQLSGSKSCDVFQKKNFSHMLNYSAGLLMVSRKKPFRVRFQVSSIPHL